MSTPVLSGERIISPYEELLAFEYLYSREGATLKKIADDTVLSNRLSHDALINQCGMFGPEEDMDETRRFLDNKLGTFSIAINGTPSWPAKLKDSERPTPLLYFRGDLGLLDARIVAVVGARKASEDGKKRARSLVKKLTEHGIVIATGLAAGIDTAAATAAIESGGHVIGIVGTPIDEYYPKENRSLQDSVGAEHLLLSQVPFYRYSTQPFKTKRYYFPERNELMAAVSDATVIVEASDTSGTLTQVRACLRQERPLFIMRSCAENEAVTWPAKYLGNKAVHVLDNVEQILDVLGQ